MVSGEGSQSVEENVDWGKGLEDMIRRGRQVWRGYSEVIWQTEAEGTRFPQA